MYKYYIKNGKVQFYTNGIELNNNVYGVRSDKDIRKIKESIVEEQHLNDDEDTTYDLETEISNLTHTAITFEQPTPEQLEIIQAKTFTETTGVAEFVEAVMNDELEESQDEINAYLMLELAKLKAGE